MADVAQEEHLNKMNARNIAMVFAPNMTQVNMLLPSMKSLWVASGNNQRKELL